MTRSKRKQEQSEGDAGLDAGIGGFFGGLAGLVDKLRELAETGEEFSRTGKIHDSNKGVRGIYGFTVKVGLADEKVRLEPFGNIRKDEKSGQTVVQEVREPAVDVLEEADYTLVVAEMPGVSANDVRLDTNDDLLTIDAARGDKKYHKEILLPHTVSRERIVVSCNNGVLEIKCLK
ncbi:MAG: Hsp20/alpha crystallin family protein [Acidobacteria bacterium]|nr:Hsp20/alpha crystallin family protein [Acidobacteriota bacterium]